jgi:hypothetical protein
MPNNQYINTIGFMFNICRIKISNNKKCFCLNHHNYHNHHHSKCKLNNKICLIKLTREQFISSTLDISTSKKEAWESFKNKIISLLNGYFLISLSKKKTFHSIFGQLILIKKSEYSINNKDYLILYFTYNHDSINQLPIQYDNNLININTYFKLRSGIYNNLKFYYDDNYSYKPNFIN